MRMIRSLTLLALALLSTEALGQSGNVTPHIGYLYPAGGKQGTIVNVMAGGQYLRLARQVYVTGEGVHAEVVDYAKQLRLKGEERIEVQRQLSERWAELTGREGPLMRRRPPRGKPAEEGPVQEDAGPVELPHHPLLNNLDSLSLLELQHVMRELFTSKEKMQRNRQLAEMVVIEVTIDPDAPPGDRELRIETRMGLTNPLCFQVGTLPELQELEPNDGEPPPRATKMAPADLPVLFNGQIKPGDIDRFRFQARKGQQLVMEVSARRLIPFLADAVPGWFQPTLALYDSRGNELAFEDDYRFRPDPVLFYTVPADGEYELEIHDAIYRGREDFVYRVSVGEEPFITGMYPLGGREDAKAVASVTGWNLPRRRLKLDTRPGGARIRQASLGDGEALSNGVAYAVDTLPECNEKEPNDTASDAQAVTLPLIVNGLIAESGDVDVFAFEGHAGDEVVAEVMARRLGSPVDSLVRLTDAAGQILAWNDDHEVKEGYLRTDMGLLTHHADSYLHARLPQDGLYRLHMSEAQRHGGEAYAYRFRISAPRPRFRLLVTPSSLSLRAGWATPICVYALREEGFDRDIDVVLADAPPGFSLSGATIPAGRDHIHMTLTVPRKPQDGPVAVKIEGRAEIDGETMRQPAIPAEDMMQAFLYRHLVPSQEFIVAVKGDKRGGAPIRSAKDDPVRIPEGGTAGAHFQIGRRPMPPEVHFELLDPPEGITLKNVAASRGMLVLELAADGGALEAGGRNNLIVGAFAELARPDPRDKGTTRKRTISVGALPAIPFEVVEQ